MQIHKFTVDTPAKGCSTQLAMLIKMTATYSLSQWAALHSFLGTFARSSLCPVQISKNHTFLWCIDMRVYLMALKTPSKHFQTSGQNCGHRISPSKSK